MIASAITGRFSVRRGQFRLDTAFEVPARGITALFGPSGCGKTTLLRAVAGLDRIAGGYLKVGEEVWQDDSRFLPPHRRPLGYVFQEANLFPHLSVRRNLEYGLRRLPPGAERVSLSRVTAFLGLEPLLERRPDNLSGGERQRVAIGRALLTSPRLLLMDEPLASLDRKSRDEIIPCLERLGEELAIPVFYVSHALEEVARLADHLLLMENGGIRDHGPIEEMLTRTDLPLARGEEAGSIVTTRVVEHDSSFLLTHLEFPGGRFTVTGTSHPVGQRVRLRIMARDISLALRRPSDSSILNIFRATVVEMAEESMGRIVVRLEARGIPFLATITNKSVSELGLEPGKRVYAQVKAVALLG